MFLIRYKNSTLVCPKTRRFWDTQIRPFVLVHVFGTKKPHNRMELYLKSDFLFRCQFYCTILQTLRNVLLFPQIPINSCYLSDSIWLSQNPLLRSFL